MTQLGLNGDLFINLLENTQTQDEQTEALKAVYQCDPKASALLFNATISPFYQRKNQPQWFDDRQAHLQETRNEWLAFCEKEWHINLTPLSEVFRFTTDHELNQAPYQRVLTHLYFEGFFQAEDDRFVANLGGSVLDFAPNSQCTNPQNRESVRRLLQYLAKLIKLHELNTNITLSFSDFFENKDAFNQMVLAWV